jgi:hypothetical protein
MCDLGYYNDGVLHIVRKTVRNTYIDKGLSPRPPLPTLAAYSPTQGYARQPCAMQERTKVCRTPMRHTGQDRTGQDRTGQGEAGQGNAKRDGGMPCRTGQGGTKQHNRIQPMTKRGETRVCVMCMDCGEGGKGYCLGIVLLCIGND